MKLENTHVWELMKLNNSCDRLVGVCSLNDSIELHIGFDRHDDDGRFTDAELEILRKTVDDLHPLGWRLAFSCGVLENQKELTCRERETFFHLLTGAPEKEIAKLMKVKPKSIHQYVMRVYQKTGITSRPQLMAKWMSLK